MLESEIERNVCKYAMSKRYLAYKFTSPARRSVPDRLFISPSGFMFFIEFKATGEKPTEAQTREHIKLRTNKIHVLVIDNISDGKMIFDILGPL